MNVPDVKSKRSIYLKFLKMVSLVLIIVVALDFGIGSLLKLFYFRQTSGVDFRTRYAMENSREDLLIFGASTAVHDYIPPTFEKRLKLSAYNVGRDAMSIFYDYAVLKAVLKRYSPKMIILAFDKDEFSQAQESYDRLSTLLPFYKTHPEIDSIIDLKGPYEKYKLISNIYPYNSLVVTISAGNSDLNKKRREDVKGFVAVNKTWPEPIKCDSSFINEPLDNNKVKAYESFIADCINAKIELYIITSPSFVKATYPSNSLVLGKAIAERYKVRFFDYSQDSGLLNNRNLFADIPHLNASGATIYSDKIANRILDERRSNWDRLVYIPLTHK